MTNKKIIGFLNIATYDDANDPLLKNKDVSDIIFFIASGLLSTIKFLKYGLKVFIFFIEDLYFF